MTTIAAMTALVVLVGLLSVRLVGDQQALVVTRGGVRRRLHGPGPALVAPLLDSVRRVDTGTRQRWDAATATTADGVQARLEAGYALRVADPMTAPPDADGLVAGLVEDRLRSLIASAAASDLPSRGDDLAWFPDSFVPGVLVERVSVVDADVAVTPELRRLLRRSRGAAWT
jgi:regulator of protease activity HflC (stomatin/prohibitin superfamily)